MDWRKLSPDEKVKVVMNMIDVVTSIAADNERQKNPGISDAELIRRLRRRFRKEPRFRTRR